MPLYKLQKVWYSNEVNKERSVCHDYHLPTAAPGR